MTSKDLRELIDACRPGHEDVNQPEFRELERELSQDTDLQRLFERSQALDREIQTTFRSVTPPLGLAERLLEAIEPQLIEGRKAAPVVADTESRVERPKHFSRRAVAMWAAVTTLAAAAAVIVLWIRSPGPTSLSSPSEIAEVVDRWNADLDQASWQPPQDLPAQDFPTWQHLDLRGVARWQWVTERRIACYDFAIDEGRVRLFVIKPAGSLSLPNTPPVGYPSPNGWHVGAWQEGGRAYYLAVHADGNSKRLYSDVIASRINPA